MGHLKSKYLIIFIVYAVLILLILSYLRFPSFRYLIRDSFKTPQDSQIIKEDAIVNDIADEDAIIDDISDEVANDIEDYPPQDILRSIKENIDSTLIDGVWRIPYPDFIPQFGGDAQNTGVYPGDGIKGLQIPYFPDDYHYWTPIEGNLVYKIRHKGLINSSPAVYDNIIYFGTYDGHFYAVDLDSGNEKWIVQIGRPARPSGRAWNVSRDPRHRSLYPNWETRPYFATPNSAVFSSPIILDGIVYFGTTYGFVYALDTKNGNIIWRSHIPDLHLSNPKIHNGYLYIGSKDKHLYKLDKKDGAIIWSYMTHGEIITTPAICSSGNIYINCQENYLYSIDTEGELNWEKDMGLSTRNSPVIYEEMVFLNTDYFHAINTINGKETWRAGPYDNISQCAVNKGRVYFTGIDEQHSNSKYIYQYFFSYNASNGRLQWKSRIEIFDRRIFDPTVETSLTRIYWDSGEPSNQMIISGNMIHYNTIGTWFRGFRDGKEYYHKLGGLLFGFTEDEEYYANFPNYPHRNPNFMHSYAFSADSLHSPIIIHNEVLYYGVEGYDEDGYYSGLYAIESKQEKYRWQSSSHHVAISYLLVSDNVIVFYDIVAKDGDNMQKGITELQILTYDIHSKEEIYSGNYPYGGTLPVKIFRRSSALYKNLLFVEIGVLSKDRNKVISNAYSAFDIIDGKYKWRYDLDENILNSPPLIHKGKIYIGTCHISRRQTSLTDSLKDSDNVFLALDAKTGEENWKIEIIGNVLSEPLIHNDTIYFGTDKGYVYAIDPFDGEIFWKFYVNGGISSTPIVYDDILFFGSWNWNIYAIDAKTGKGLWKFRARGIVRRDISAHDGHIYFLSEKPEKISFSFRPEPFFLQSINIKTGSENSNLLFLPNRFSSYIIKDSTNPELLYTLSSSQHKISAIDTRTGSILWEKQTDDFHSSKGFHPRFFQAIDDKIYSIFINTRHIEGYILTISAKTGELLQKDCMSEMGVPEIFIQKLQPINIRKIQINFIESIDRN